jgi:hypothetical protein
MDQPLEAPNVHKDPKVHDALDRALDDLAGLELVEELFLALALQFF